MTFMQVYAAYVAPVVLVLIGLAIRRWNAHRVSVAHRSLAEGGKR